jgi:hypothetical protein
LRASINIAIKSFSRSGWVAAEPETGASSAIAMDGQTPNANKTTPRESQLILRIDRRSSVMGSFKF